MRTTSVALVLLVAVGVVWCGQTVRKAERSTGNDLVGYLAASEALYTQQDPYHLPDRFPYIYPLFLATVLRPLSMVGVRTATIVWFAIECTCLVFILRRARLRVGRLDVSGVAAAAFVVAVFGDVLQLEFLNGQVNLVVVALIVASVQFSDRRPHLAPALLGAAIAIKLTPALMLVYWIVRRRFAFFVQACGWAILFVLLPWLVVGDRLWSLYDDYLHNFILARTASSNPHGTDIFFSLYGFLGWVTSSPPGRPVVVLSALAVLAVLLLWHAATVLGVRARFSNWGRGQTPLVTAQPLGDNLSAHPTGGDPGRDDPGRDPGRARAAARWARDGWHEGAAWVYLAATPLLAPMSEVHHLTAALPLAPLTGTAGVPFALFLWIGRVDRRGPWYFLAVVSLVIAGALVIGRRSKEAV